jgi:hypothetical protein
MSSHLRQLQVSQQFIFRFFYVYRIKRQNLKTTTFWDVVPCSLVEVDPTSQKGVIFTLAVVRTWNLTRENLALKLRQ